MYIDGKYIPNISCKVCRRRHPGHLRCDEAKAIADAGRAKRKAAEDALPKLQIELPDWQATWDKQHRPGQELTALEQFILDHEPSGVDDERIFREGLTAVLEEQRKIYG